MWVEESEDKEDEVPQDLQKSQKVKTVWVLMIQAYEEEGKRGQIVKHRLG